MTDPPGPDLAAVMRAVRSEADRAAADTFTDIVHDPAADVSDARRPSPAETEVLDLLHLPHPRPYVRMSREDWAIVDGVVEALEQARHEGGAA